MHIQVGRNAANKIKLGSLRYLRPNGEPVEVVGILYGERYRVRIIATKELRTVKGAKLDRLSVNRSLTIREDEQRKQFYKWKWRSQLANRRVNQTTRTG